jgi:hypothetical protein
MLVIYLMDVFGAHGDGQGLLWFDLAFEALKGMVGGCLLVMSFRVVKEVILFKLHPWSGVLNLLEILLLGRLRIEVIFLFAKHALEGRLMTVIGI